MLIKDINFFDRYKEVERREKNISKTAAIQVVAIAGVLIITMITSSVMQIKKVDVQGEIDRINAYINSPETLEKVAAIEKKQLVLTNVTNYHDAIALANYKLGTIIQPDKAMVQSIVGLLPGGVVVTDFQYSGGNISLQCKSDTEDKIAQYVHSLKSVDTVYAIGYSGFQKSETEYESSITIGLLPGGEKDAANQ
ncbi:MAG: PilN domain-containing protein [Cellulosilyticaceae bacterium]